MVIPEKRSLQAERARDLVSALLAQGFSGKLILSFDAAQGLKPDYKKEESGVLSLR